MNEGFPFFWRASTYCSVLVFHCRFVYFLRVHLKPDLRNIFLTVGSMTYDETPSMDNFDYASPYRNHDGHESKLQLEKCFDLRT